MKIINLKVNKLEIEKFFPSKNEVELKISFDDGAEKTILKTVDTSKPEDSAKNIVEGLRKLEKSMNKDDEEKNIIESFVNIIIEDEDSLQEKMGIYFQKIQVKLEELSIKKEAAGYLDLIRNLKSLKLEF